MNTIDTEVRLTEALGAQADTITQSTPPRFSWELPPVADLGRHRGTSGAGRRRRVVPALKVALPAAVAAAVLVTALVDSSSGSKPSTAQGAPAALFLRPGGVAPMTAGQYFYRKDISVGPNGNRTVTELWQPQDITGSWVVKSYITTAAGAVLGQPNQQSAACGEFLTAVGGGPVCDVNGSWSKPTPKFLATLPTDPHALYSALYDYIVADYKTTANDRSLNFSTANLAFLTINYIRSIASSAGGMSEPFSKALQGAAALVPGVIVKENAKTLSGATGTSYEIDYTSTNIAGPLIFDSAGNFIGSPTSSVDLGVAASGGGAPTIS
jgi:hypothetical protein